jgi:hypothetical protein
MDLRVAASQESSAPAMLDGVSRMTFRRDTWCKQPPGEGDSCYDPLALAVTSVFARKSDGQIVDADVELNAVTFRWSDLVRRPEISTELQDLQNTLTHEFGHFIGLDHTCFIAFPKEGVVDDQGRPVPSCSNAPADVRATTMFASVIPGDLDRRTLSPDDRNAVCDVYPPIDLTIDADLPRGSCAVEPRGADPGALLWVGLAAAAAIACRRRRPAAPPATTPR